MFCNRLHIFSYSYCFKKPLPLTLPQGMVFAEQLQSRRASEVRAINIFVSLVLFGLVKISK